MPFYIYSSGEQLENYKSYYAWLKVRKGKTAQQVSDSVKKVFGAMKEPKKKTRYYGNGFCIFVP